MEIKMRRKGNVITFDGFQKNDIPSVIQEQNIEELDGIDLTGYPVFSVSYGRRGDERAKELHEKHPYVIVVYKYEWRNGWGQGIILPKNFNPQKVEFYKSANQLEKEAKQAQTEKLEALREKILLAIPGIDAYTKGGSKYVEISPRQETFSKSFDVLATTLEEAQKLVKAKRKDWKTWNKRVLDIFGERGYKNPGIGNIQLIFKNPTSTRPYNRVGIGYRQKIDDKYIEGWIVLKEVDGKWVEDRDLTGPAANYISVNL